MCESRGGRPGLPVPNSSELRSCVKVEMADLGSPSLIVQSSGAVCESRNPGLPVPNSSELRSCVKVEMADLGSPSLIVQSSGAV